MLLFIIIVICYCLKFKTRKITHYHGYAVVDQHLLHHYVVTVSLVDVVAKLCVNHPASSHGSICSLESCMLPADNCESPHK